MLGINGGEFLVLLVVVLLVVGPERLPDYAAQLGSFVRRLRRMALDAREQVREELGPEFDEVDWRKLDPRQYDPRRIVKDALSEAWDDDPGAASTRSTSSGPATRSTSSGRRYTSGRRPAVPGAPPPFDDEAT
ncbi:twin-arginine translocase TatA/TatE family subunit [Quadrisphaera sp. GCM10027208]|uniref:twin-arginine translocase TatA/TatE family subunit n=1 Tax=Quadrisphaera sp. GCM10027208 TaxID=3273423 RepID=UPI00361D9E7C